MTVINSFSRRAQTYDSQSFIQIEVNRRLLKRLELIKHDKSNILDIGSGTGKLSLDIKKKYPSTIVTCLDISYEMQQVHRRKEPMANCIVGSAERPPFEPSSFDTILSSLTLHWCSVSSDLFKNISSLLTPNGLFLFSVVGPDTLKEFRRCPSEIYRKLRFNSYIDMHHYGDLMLSADFKDPVVDNEQITIEFRSFEQLLKSLRFTGTNLTSTSSQTRITKSEYLKIKDCLFNETSKTYDITYDIIFGYALKPNKTPGKSGKFIEIKELKKE